MYGLNKMVIGGYWHGMPIIFVQIESDLSNAKTPKKDYDCSSFSTFRETRFDINYGISKSKKLLI